MQNTNDPVSSFEEVRAYLRKQLPVNSYPLVELPGDTHRCGDLATLKTLMSELLQS